MKIIPVYNKDIDTFAPLLPEEVTEAMKEGLPVTVFAAVENSIAVGTLAGVIDSGVFELISIYVHPDHRGNGVGEALLDRLYEALKGEDIPVFTELTLQDEEDEILQSFLEDQGFEETGKKLPSWYFGRLKDLQTDFSLSEEASENVKAFKEVPKNVLNELSSEGVLVPEGSLTADSIDKELSCCVVFDGKVKAYLAVEIISEKLVKIPAIYSALPDPRGLMAMISKTAEKLVKLFPPETEVAMLAANETSEKLIRKVFRKVENRTKRFYRV